MTKTSYEKEGLNSLNELFEKLIVCSEKQDKASTMRIVSSLNDEEKDFLYTWASEQGKLDKVAGIVIKAEMDKKAFDINCRFKKQVLEALPIHGYCLENDPSNPDSFGNDTIKFTDNKYINGEIRLRDRKVYLEARDAENKKYEKTIDYSEVEDLMESINHFRKDIEETFEKAEPVVEEVKEEPFDILNDKEFMKQIGADWAVNLAKKADSGDVLDLSFEEAMALDPKDPRAVEYLSKNFDVTDITTRAILEMCGNMEDAYNEMTNIANEKGYGWDQVSEERDEEDEALDEPVLIDTAKYLFKGEEHAVTFSLVREFDTIGEEVEGAKYSILGPGILGLEKYVSIDIFLPNLDVRLPYAPNFADVPGEVTNLFIEKAKQDLKQLKANKVQASAKQNLKKKAGTSNFWDQDGYPLIAIGDEQVYSEKDFIEEYNEEHPDEKIQEIPGELRDNYYSRLSDAYQIVSEDMEGVIDSKDIPYGFKITIKPGYYEGIQLFVEEPDDYFQDTFDNWLRDKYNKDYDDLSEEEYTKYNDEYEEDMNKLFEADKQKVAQIMEDIGKEYGWLQLAVAYRFSNGETGYNIVNKKSSKESTIEKEANEPTLEILVDIEQDKWEEALKQAEPILDSVSSRTIYNGDATLKLLGSQSQILKAIEQLQDLGFRHLSTRMIDDGKDWNQLLD